MKRKHTADMITSAFGLVIVLGILIAVNVVLGAVRLRKDLTGEKLYTLSDGTRHLVGALDRTVTLKFYYSRSNEAVPMPIKQYADRVTDLLREYKAAGHGRVVIETYDPKPDSNEEEWAEKYGLSGRSMGMLGEGPTFYLGIVAVSGKNEASIPSLAPEAEPQLEYLLTRLLYEVTLTQRPGLAVMSPLPVMGSAEAAPSFPPMQQPGQRQPWIVATELQKQYDVTTLGMEAESVPTNIDLLVVVHPKQFPEKTLYALDQFVLRGGHLLVFEDPLCLAEQESGEQQQGMFGGGGSDLNRLTKGWGVEMQPSEVVADLQAASQVGFGGGGSDLMSTWLSLRDGAISREDTATTPLEFVMMPFAGALDVKPVEGITVSKLIQTSDDTSLVNSFQARSPGAEKMRSAQTRGRTPLAVRLQGIFPSAFPEGPPKSGEGEAAKEPAAESKAAHLAKGTKPGIVLVVADVDVLYDRFCVRPMEFFGQQVGMQPINDNLNFALNLIEQLAGSETLIGLRSRGTFDRPFDRVIDLEKKAQARWQEEELKLTTQLQETQARLHELQTAKTDDEKTILSPEQKREIERFREQRFETQRQLKEVRKNLRGDIEQLGMKVKVMNIAAMPLLVALFGLVRGWRRRG